MKKAKLFGSNFDTATLEQLNKIMEVPAVQKQNVALMPDGHKGTENGAPIGFTMTTNDKEIIPSLVSADIGCGVLVHALPKFVKTIDYEKLGDFLSRGIPTGYHLRTKRNKNNAWDGLAHYEIMRAKNVKDIDKARRGVGTLGDGNHYIEIGRSEKTGRLYLSIHSGSRSYGGQVGTYYERLAKEKSFVVDKNEFAKRVKEIPEEQRQRWIEANKVEHKKVAYPTLTGQDRLDYIHDMRIGIVVAYYNRLSMLERIFKHLAWQNGLKWDEMIYDDQFGYWEKDVDMIETVHNYYDLESGIIRKGAVSAELEERIIIPLNMRDGALIARGLGNKEANFSAPHGAGRLGSRKWAKDKFNLDDLKKSMTGVISHSLNESTIDELPMAYKTKETILEGLKGLATVEDIIVPVFNFKHSEIKKGKNEKKN